MRKLKFEIYEADDGWRWRGKLNGRIMCESGEAYQRRSGCRKSLLSIIGAIIEGRYDAKDPQDIEFG